MERDIINKDILLLLFFKDILMAQTFQMFGGGCEVEVAKGILLANGWEPLAYTFGPIPMPHAPRPHAEGQGAPGCSSPWSVWLWPQC